MAHIGEKIMERRKAMGITQEELARRMGYKSKSTINKIEMGINDIPQSKVAKFSEVLGVSIAYLLDWQEEQKQNDILADIIVKLRTDEKFMEATTLLHQLDNTQMDSIIQMLKAFVK